MISITHVSSILLYRLVYIFALPLEEVSCA